MFIFTVLHPPPPRQDDGALEESNTARYSKLNKNALKLECQVNTNIKNMIFLSI